jgi:hypothetical protein
MVETFHDVQLLRASDVNWCRINGRTVLVPPRHFQPGTTVHRAGDRGCIVIPSWLARDLGLTGVPCTTPAP